MINTNTVKQTAKPYCVKGATSQTKDALISIFADYVVNDLHKRTSLSNALLSAIMLDVQWFADNNIPLSCLPPQIQRSVYNDASLTLIDLLNFANEQRGYFSRPITDTLGIMLVTTVVVMAKKLQLSEHIVINELLDLMRINTYTNYDEVKYQYHRYSIEGNYFIVRFNKRQLKLKLTQKPNEQRSRAFADI